MQRVGFVMKLYKGFEDEYRKRHDAIWPELAALLHETGVREYSIFLQEETGNLFGFLKIDDALKLDSLPSHPVMQRWWEYMKDIMESNPDNSPVSKTLKKVFYLA